MLNKNSFLTGILTGTAFPVIACTVYYFYKNTYYLAIRPALPFFVAIAVNLVLLRIGFKRDAHKTVTGIMLSTFVFMLLIFAFKIYPLK